jgi:hypothetical protein
MPEPPTTIPAEQGEAAPSDHYYDQLGVDDAGMPHQDAIEGGDGPEMGTEGLNFMTEASQASHT